MDNEYNFDPISASVAEPVSIDAVSAPVDMEKNAGGGTAQCVIA